MRAPQIGFAGAEEPAACIPAVVGRCPPERSAIVIPGKGALRCFVGAGAVARRLALDLNAPYRRGAINDPDGLARLLRLAFEALGVAPDARPLLLALPPVWGAEARRALVQLLLADFRVPALYLTTPAVLALYACGRTDGVVLDAGYSSTSVVPISGGRPVRAAAAAVAFGGRNLVSRLMAPGGAMAEAGLTGGSDRELAADILARLGYVAAAPDLERLRPEAEVAGEYTLPSGRVVRLAHARHAAFEPLFAPSPADGGEACVGDGVSLARLLADAVLAAPEEARADMLRSVLLVGGVSLAPGFATRLQAELSPLLPAELRPAVRVFAPRARQATAWAGGAALAAQLSGQLWVTREAFDAGPDAALAALDKQVGL